MHPTEIADTLSRLEWETLRALRAPSSDSGRLSPAAVQQLLRSNLLEFRADRPALTARGRQVVISGSPLLWNS